MRRSLLYLLLLSMQHILCASSELDAFFYLSYDKEGTSADRLYRVELADEIIYDDEVNSGPSKTVQLKTFNRELKPGVKYRLRFEQESELETAVGVILPDGFSAEWTPVTPTTSASNEFVGYQYPDDSSAVLPSAVEADGSLGDAQHSSSVLFERHQADEDGSGDVDRYVYEYDLVIRDIDVLEGREATPFGVASSLNVADLRWSVGLGQLPGGRAAGYISYADDEISADSFNRSVLGLQLAPHNDGDVQAVYEDLDGVGPEESLRQVLTTQGFVDIVDIAEGAVHKGFEIVFYSAGEADSSNPGYFKATSGATELVRYRFYNSATGQLTLTANDGSIIRYVANYIAGQNDADDWSLSVVGGDISIQNVVNASDLGGGSYDEVSHISYTSIPTSLPEAAHVTFSTRQVYETLTRSSGDDLNDLLVERSYNHESSVSGFSARSETFDYWDEDDHWGVGAVHDQFGLRQSHVSTFGEWMYHEYDDININRLNETSTGTDPSFEALIQWLKDERSVSFFYAFIPFQRKLTYSYMPIGDAFDFEQGLNYDFGTDQDDILVRSFGWGPSWDESRPEAYRIVDFGYHDGGWTSLEAAQLEPITFPTSVSNGNTLFHDFVTVERRRYLPQYTQNSDFYIASTGTEFYSVYVPHAHATGFDYRKAYKPHFNKSWDLLKTVHGYSDLNGYNGDTSASWAEISISGVGEYVVGSEGYFSLNILLDTGARMDRVSYMWSMRLLDLFSNSEETRRKAYLGADEVLGGAKNDGTDGTDGPMDLLLNPAATPYMHGSVTFNGMDKVNLVAGKSDKRVRILNDEGELVRTEQWVYDSDSTWQLVEVVRFEYDAFSRLTASYRSSDGEAANERRTYFCQYDGLRKDYEIDELGVRTDYEYDGLDRVVAVESTKLHGAAGIPETLRTEYAHDAMGRVVLETRFSPEDSVSVFRLYDAEGLLVKYVDDFNLENATGDETTISYAQAVGAGKQVTMTFPDNSNLIRIYSRDGRLKQESGSAVTSKYYTYSYDWGDTGFLTTRVDVGYPSDSSTVHPWSERTQDMIGRSVSERFADPDGNQFETLYAYDADNGRLKWTLLTKLDEDGTSDAPPLKTLYEYDELGVVQRSGIAKDASSPALVNVGTDWVLGSKYRLILPDERMDDSNLLEEGNYMRNFEKFFPKN